MPVSLLLHFAPYIAMAVMGLGIWGLWQEHKADSLKHANDQAVIQQNLKDHANSEKQIGLLQGKLEVIDAKAQPIIQRIVSAPVTTGCGPVVRTALDGVRELRDSSDEQTGRKPPVAKGVPTPLAAPVNKPK
jgi:hypothetical protein